MAECFFLLVQSLQQYHLQWIHIPEEQSKTNNDYDCSLWVDVTAAGLLMGRSEPAPAKVNLTTEGSLDWIQWGLSGNDSVIRKSTGGSKLSDLTEIGKGFRGSTAGCGVEMSWNDGAPTPSVNSSPTGLWWNVVDHGYSLTAPADSQERVLKVYVGGIGGAHGKLTAHLSDNSAPDYVSDTWDGNAGQGHWAAVPGSFYAVYTLRYRAASPGQNITVSWVLIDEPNRARGQARIQAAALSESHP